MGRDQSYEEFVARELEPGSVIDARNTDFRVANSRNASPSENSDCEVGTLPVNPYPLKVYESLAAVVLGGRFDGEVPQLSEWLYTYCNSAAVGFWDSPHAGVEGLRVRRVWDGIRFARDSRLFRVEQVWLSEVRDDCVENDFLLDGTIRDSLLDGCFSAISMRSPDETARGSDSATVTLAGVLIRLEPFLYEGDIKQGFPLKVNEASPEVAMYDSVIAIGDAETISPSSWNAAWSKVADCSNNLFLWTSDRPWPDQLALPPSCFRVLRGDEARSVWQDVRQNWIDCHNPHARFADDTVPDPSRCDRLAYGGQY